MRHRAGYARFNGDVSKVSTAAIRQLLEDTFAQQRNGEVEPCCGAKIFRPFQGVSIHDVRFEARPVVLVGHSIGSDLANLRSNGFQLGQIIPVVSYLDTQQIAKEQYGTDEKRKRPSLKDACKGIVGIEAKGCHWSGNDAAYALLLLVVLAIEILEDEAKGGDASGTHSIYQHLTTVKENGLQASNLIREEFGTTAQTKSANVPQTRSADVPHR